MKKREDVIAHLGGVPLFSACTKKDLQHVAKYSEHVRVPAGTDMTQEGRTGSEFFVILDGKAAVLRDGREVATLGAGDSFGELALLDRAPRNATVRATSDVDALVMGQREFTAALDVVPSLAHKLLIGLARRIHTLDGQAVN
ncbi:MAG TPA: cyclic nucleotide-binding domain-containing protein [Acidimicrobiales bacterium]|nr:cyclic nucleotide-binding domain-containing protein [Acidimicrobiales bacterium]